MGILWGYSLINSPVTVDQSKTRVSDEAVANSELKKESIGRSELLFLNIICHAPVRSESTIDDVVQMSFEFEQNLPGDRIVQQD